MSDPEWRKEIDLNSESPGTSFEWRAERTSKAESEVAERAGTEMHMIFPSPTSFGHSREVRVPGITTLIQTEYMAAAAVDGCRAVMQLRMP